MTRYDFDAIGTKWQIEIAPELDSVDADELFRRITERIQIFDATYSRFRADSLVTQMSKRAGNFIVPSDAEPLLVLYRDLYERTDGLFTPLVGDMLSDAGYDAEYSLVQTKDLTAAPAWGDVFEYRAPELVMHIPALLDFGAGGKGYLADLVAEVIEQEGITEYVVDAGGDIVHRGSEAIRVGLEDPEEPEKVIGVCELQNGSVCGSAGNRRAWGDFTHIMDPKSRSSPRNVLAVWVTAKNGLLADALATCLFFVSAESLSLAYSFEYVLMRSDRSIEHSVGFQGELFTR